MAAVAFGTRAVGQYVIREQVQRHKREMSDRLDNMFQKEIKEIRAGNDGQHEEAYRLRQASANIIMCQPSPVFPDPSPNLCIPSRISFLKTE